MKQRIWAFLTALVLLFTLVVPVLAADTAEDYIGELDPSTGLPLGSYKDADGESSTYIVVDDAFHYDPEKKIFLYTIGSSRFSSNIPNGAVVPDDQTVSIQLPGGVTGTLYRDGSAVEEADLTAITETGFYVLQLTGSGLYDSGQFTFTIMPDLTNQMNKLRLPEGFSFAYIMQNGIELDHAHSNYYEFLEDGEYQICWRNETINRQYIVKFTLDRQAPTLALPEVVDGKASSQVSLSDLEAGCYIVVETNGESRTLKGTGNTLKEAGDYVLTVYDQAGNFTQYSFTIEFYLNFSAVAVIIMVLLILAGILIYCRRVRKTARVG